MGLALDGLKIFYGGLNLMKLADTLLDNVSEITIDFVVLDGGKTPTPKRKCSFPFLIKIDSDRKLVHIMEVEEGSIRSSLDFRFMYVDKFQNVAESVLNDKEARFYLYYKGGGVSKNWNEHLAGVQEEDKEYLIALNEYSFVGWEKESGEFHQSPLVQADSVERAIEIFEQQYPKYIIIHSFLGLPKKVFRSLGYTVAEQTNLIL